LGCGAGGWRSGADERLALVRLGLLFLPPVIAASLSFLKGWFAARMKTGLNKMTDYPQ
jgi:hypothetical protein